METTEISVALLSVKARAEDIRNRLNELHLNFAKNQYLQWPEVLEQFSVLSGQFYSLNEDIPQMLTHFVLHPQTLQPRDPNQIPELLRTKALPEMENEEQMMVQQYETEMKGLDLDQAKKVAVLQMGIEQYNSMCEQAEDIFEELKEQMSLKSKRAPLTTENNQAALKTLLGAMTHGNGLKQVKPIPPVTKSNFGSFSNSTQKISQQTLQDLTKQLPQHQQSSILSTVQNLPMAAKFLSTGNRGIQTGSVGGTMNVASNQTLVQNIQASQFQQNPALVLQHLQQHNLQRQHQ